MSDDTEIQIENEPTKEVLGKLPKVYWLTRGTRHGELQNYIEIWAVKPDRIRFDDGDVMWMAPPDVIDIMPTLVGEWSLWESYRECKVYPEDDRMCIRVGNEPVRTIDVS